MGISWKGVSMEIEEDTLKFKVTSDEWVNSMLKSIIRSRVYLGHKEEKYFYNLKKLWNIIPRKTVEKMLEKIREEVDPNEIETDRNNFILTLNNEAHNYLVKLIEDHFIQMRLAVKKYRRQKEQRNQTNMEEVPLEEQDIDPKKERLRNLTDMSNLEINSISQNDYPEALQAAIKKALRNTQIIIHNIKLGIINETISNTLKKIMDLIRHKNTDVTFSYDLNILKEIFGENATNNILQGLNVSNLIENTLILETNNELNQLLINNIQAKITLYRNQGIQRLQELENKKRIQENNIQQLKKELQNLTNMNNQQITSMTNKIIQQALISPNFYNLNTINRILDIDSSSIYNVFRMLATKGIPISLRGDITESSLNDAALIFLHNIIEKKLQKQQQQQQQQQKQNIDQILARLQNITKMTNQEINNLTKKIMHAAHLQENTDRTHSYDLSVLNNIFKKRKINLFFDEFKKTTGHRIIINNQKRLILDYTEYKILFNVIKEDIIQYKNRATRKPNQPKRQTSRRRN